MDDPEGRAFREGHRLAVLGQLTGKGLDVLLLIVIAAAGEPQGHTDDHYQPAYGAHWEKPQRNQGKRNVTLPTPSDRKRGLESWNSRLPTPFPTRQGPAG